VQLNLINQPLGKYRILEEIGRGGMGVVYKAHDTVLDRLVAIKVLAPHLTWDQEFVQRFLHEARTAARLEHSHIVTIYEVGRTQDHHFIAMEYLEGHSLAEIVRREGPLPPERAVHILGQIAQALDYAHAQGLVHRDVKPGNIIVGRQDHATLTDFGVARSLEGTRLTQSGVIVGTPAYMSPEQVKGKPVGTTTDVYALGVVAYEMLGGRPPFEGETPHVLYAHVYEEPAPLAKVSPAIWTVVHKALAKEPAKRYGSAEVFAAALGQAIRSRTTEVVRQPLSRFSQVSLWPLLGALGAMLLLVALVFGIGRFGHEPAAPVPPERVSGETVVATTTQVQVTHTPDVGATATAKAQGTTAAKAQATATARARAVAATEAAATSTATTAATQKATVQPPTETAVAAATEATAAQTGTAIAAVAATRTAVAATATAVAQDTTRAAEVAATRTAIAQSATQTVVVAATETGVTQAAATQTAVVAATQTAMAHSVINLLQPTNGVRVSGLVTFQWAWTGTLRPSETFDVRVCKGEGCQPQFGKTNTDEITWQWCPDASGGIYRWQVLVIDKATKQPKGPTSGVWEFIWEGGCGQPTPTSTPVLPTPTNTATPPPTPTNTPRPPTPTPTEQPYPPPPTPTPIPSPYP